MAVVVPVPVESAWTSKINWTQAVGVVCTMAALFTAGKYDVPASEQAILVAGIQSVQAFATWVFRTWFTTSVTPSSVPPPVPRPRP